MEQKKDYDGYLKAQSEKELREINEIKQQIKAMTQKAKMREMDVLNQKEELESYKEALLMREQEAMKANADVHLELKKVQDLTSRIDQKIDSLQIPPPKYYFPQNPWSYTNGVPETLPMVYCSNCAIHHHPHHHCNVHSRCNKPPVIKENYIYISQTPQVTTKRKQLGKVSSL